MPTIQAIPVAGAWGAITATATATTFTPLRVGSDYKDLIALVNTLAGATIGIPNPAVVAALQAQIVALQARLDANDRDEIGKIEIVGKAGVGAKHLACVGGTQLIASYPLLFAEIGTTFGGNGTTTFGIPDLKGRAPAGTGDGDATGHTDHVLGTKYGKEQYALSAVESGTTAHTHPSTSTFDGNHYHTLGNGAAASGGVDHSHTGYTGNDAPDHAHGQLVTAGTGGPAARLDFYADGSGWGYDQVQGTFGASARHTHGVQTYTASAYAHGHGLSGRADYMSETGYGAGPNTTGSVYQHYHTVNASTAAAASSTHENRGPVMALTFKIRALM